MIKLKTLGLLGRLVTNALEVDSHMQSSAEMVDRQSPQDVQSMLNVLDRADQDTGMANLIMNIQQVQMDQNIEQSVGSIETDVRVLRRD